MSAAPLVWLRRLALLAVFALLGLGALVAAAPERLRDPDPGALPRLIAARQAALDALATDAAPLQRAEAEAMLADAQRTLAELEGAPDAAHDALRLYERAAARLDGTTRPDLLAHVELHRGDVLLHLGRPGAAAVAYGRAADAFDAAGQPLLARTARQRRATLAGGR